MPYLRSYDSYDEMPDRMKERVCEEHMVAHVKNAMGYFRCPVCVVEESLDLEG